MFYGCRCASFKALVIAVAVVCLNWSSGAWAGVQAHHGTIDTLFSGSMFQFGNGLAYDNGLLYYFDYNRVVSIDVNSEAVVDLATVGSNAGPAFVTYYNGNTYASYTTSYASVTEAAGSSTGVVSGGIYTEKSTLSGTYDAAVAPGGTTYIVASPYPLGSENGTEIHTIDWSTGATTQIGVIGGPTGGVAVDASGNLYYAHFNDSAVYRFDAADLAGGSVTLDDATLIANTQSGPGYLALNNELIFVTEGKTINAYDLATGTLRYTAATVNDEAGAQGAQESIYFGSIGLNGNTLYAVTSNYDYTFAPDANPISQVLAIGVPEPASLALLIGGGLTMAVRRRCHR